MTLATFWENCTFRTLEALASVALLLISAQASGSQQFRESQNNKSFIETIEVTGNRRIPSNIILGHIVARPGDPYSAEAVKRDAQQLRNTGYFYKVRPRIEDIPDRPDHKLVAFDVTEKPLVAQSEYKGIKSITKTEIVQSLKENKIDISVES